MAGEKKLRHYLINCPEWVDTDQRISLVRNVCRPSSPARLQTPPSVASNLAAHRERAASWPSRVGREWHLVPFAAQAGELDSHGVEGKQLSAALRAKDPTARTAPAARLVVVLAPAALLALLRAHIRALCGGRSAPGAEALGVTAGVAEAAPHYALPTMALPLRPLGAQALQHRSAGCPDAQPRPASCAARRPLPRPPVRPAAAACSAER